MPDYGAQISEDEERESQVAEGNMDRQGMVRRILRRASQRDKNEIEDVAGKALLELPAHGPAGDMDADNPRHDVECQRGEANPEQADVDAGKKADSRYARGESGPAGKNIDKMQHSVAEGRAPQRIIHPSLR